MSNTIGNALPTNMYDINNNYNSSGFAENKSLTDNNLFLKMLAVNMQTQDPSNPTDSSEFMNQMLQYSTMETLTKVTSGLNSLVEIANANNMNTVISTAIEMAGKNVTVTDKNTGGNVTGIVDSVSIDNSGIYLEIDGRRYEYDTLSKVNKQ